MNLLSTPGNGGEDIRNVDKNLCSACRLPDGGLTTRCPNRLICPLIDWLFDQLLD